MFNHLNSCLKLWFPYPHLEIFSSMPKLQGYKVMRLHKFESYARMYVSLTILYAVMWRHISFIVVRKRLG